MQKKVLFTLDTISLGGAELSLLELVANLTEFEPIVCVTYQSSQHLRKKFQDYGIKLIYLDIAKRFGFIEGVAKLKKVIEKEKPDLVHSTHFRTEIISRLAVPSFNIPLIGSLISDTYSKDRYRLVSSREKFKLELFRILNKLTAYRTDFFISVSEAIVKPNQKYLGIPSRKIKVIPNGRNTREYSNAQPFDRHSIFPQINMSDKVIVSNSRVIRSKGFDEIFKAFSLLCKNRTDLYLLIIGGGEQLEHYKLLSQKYEIDTRVQFLGNRSDMAALLKACDIFWFASHYEGSPGVIIEGMLAQLPIIASNIGPVLENLSDKVNALLFSKGNAVELADKTLYLLNNWEERKSMTEKAYQLAVVKFCIKEIAKTHENFYNEVICAKE